MLWSCYVCGLVIHTINLSSPTVNALVTEQKSASSKLKTLKTQDCVQTIVDSNTSSSGGVAHSSIVELEGREIDAAARPANQGQRWPCTCFSVKLSEERLYRNNKRQRTVFFSPTPELEFLDRLGRSLRPCRRLDLTQSLHNSFKGLGTIVEILRQFSDNPLAFTHVEVSGRGAKLDLLFSFMNDGASQNGTSLGLTLVFLDSVRGFLFTIPFSGHLLFSFRFPLRLSLCRPQLRLQASLA